MTLLIIAVVVTFLLSLAAFAYGLTDDGPFTAFLYGGAVLLVAGLVLCLPAAFWAQAHYNDRHITCTVVDKDRGANDGGYRIYTKQCGVLADSDSWFRGKTNSADIWAQIHVGETYRFHVVGWRFGLTSDFPNILSVEAAS